ncbi:MAG: hypothetical protein HZB57_05425, partial [Gammaproteobacteria bacterium]|nr:hypothetical protein [Gammaproteobacteria bacterium]
MKLLVYLLVSLTIAVILGLSLAHEPGYVLIGYGDWTLETTLSLLLFTLCAGFAAIYLLLRFLAGLKRAPLRLRLWEQKRKAVRTRNTLTHGLI